MTEQTIVRLTSNGFVYTPGFIAAMRNDYDIIKAMRYSYNPNKDKLKYDVVKLVAETYFNGNKEAAEYVLANPDKCTVEEEADALLVEGLREFLDGQEDQQ